MLQPEPMKIGSTTFDFKRPYVVGILNLTPDSFSSGAVFNDPPRALDRCLQMVEEGADIVDIGGESSRPGSDAIPVEEEVQRVLPVVRLVCSRTWIPISVDTTKAAVAELAMLEGASVVNDVSGLRFEPRLASVAARYNATIILMHSRRTPRDMQMDIRYGDLFGEVREELGRSIRTAREYGVPLEHIIVDPGIGFAKEAQHNLRILAGLGELEPLGRPVMVGPSRKAFIGHVTGAAVDERLGGTAAAVAAAVAGGAHFVRVHDVRQMHQAAMIAHAIRSHGEIR